MFADVSDLGIFFTDMENVGPSIGITVAVTTVVIVALGVLIVVSIRYKFYLLLKGIINKTVL